MSVEDSIILEWVKNTLDGDQESFAELVNTFQNAVYNLCYRMLGERTEAEDATQEAFLRAYLNMDRYDPARSFKTWVLSIASNHCIDRLRKRRLMWLSLDEPLPPNIILSSNEPEPEDATIQDERSQAIQTLLGGLSTEYRAAVILRYWYDYSYAEIADILDTTESAIKSRLFRARQSLADRLEAQAPNSALMRPLLESL
ncbi:MAG: sigma-70 family RNA polymerase sigma factor [Anaerolineae bacterium]|nr:sigma-70 family RNA polymerase sigma factor [Anaerolineae bacterium]